MREASGRFEVLLVSPPYGTTGNSMRPLGLMALAAYLRQQFPDQLNVRICDFSDLPESETALLGDFGADRADVVGFTAYSTNFSIVRNWALAAKALRPGMVTVLGGPHANVNAEHIARAHSDAFDFVVQGEGEEPLAEIVRALRASAVPSATGLYARDPSGAVRGCGTAVIGRVDSLPTPMSDIESPYPSAMTYWDKRQRRLRKAVAITSSRGCPFSCSFCSIITIGAKWRGVSPARLETWITEIVRASPTPVEHIYFMDADFSIDLRRVVSIGKLFSEHFADITWSFSARVDDIARAGLDVLQTLAGQGLRFIESGLESGSDEVLQRMHKKVTVAQNHHAVRLLRAAGLDVTVDFIMFMPDSEPRHLEENLQFLLDAGLAEHYPHDHFFTYLLLYPGTPLRDHYASTFGMTLDPDVLPEPDALFTDRRTRNIFRLFIRESGVLRRRIDDLLDSAERAALALQDRDPPRAQMLRLEAVSLRHMPFFILKSLIDQPLAESVAAAAPWVADWDAYESEMRELCRATTQPLVLA